MADKIKINGKTYSLLGASWFPKKLDNNKIKIDLRKYAKKIKRNEVSTGPDRGIHFIIWEIIENKFFVNRLASSTHELKKDHIFADWITASIGVRDPKVDGIVHTVSIKKGIVQGFQTIDRRKEMEEAIEREKAEEAELEAKNLKLQADRDAVWEARFTRKIAKANGRSDKKPKVEGQ